MKIIFLIVFLMAFVLPIPLYKILTSQSAFGFIEYPDAGAWLAYIGAVIGGGLTLMGVSYTQKKQNDQYRLNSLPFLQLLNISMKKMPPDTQISYLMPNKVPIEQKNYPRLRINVEVKNIGRDAALDLIPIVVTYANTVYDIVSSANSYTLDSKQINNLEFEMPYSGNESIVPIDFVIGFNDILGNFYTQKYSVGVQINTGSSLSGSGSLTFEAAHPQLSTSLPELNEPTIRWKHTVGGINNSM